MPPGASRATGESTEEIYEKDVFNAIDQERLMDKFFLL